VLSFDRSKPAKYPNGRLFTDDVIDCRIAFLTKNQSPPTGLKSHTDAAFEKQRSMKPVPARITPKTGADIRGASGSD
jgi:hypothetical protein